MYGFRLFDYRRMYLMLCKYSNELTHAWSIDENSNLDSYKFRPNSHTIFAGKSEGNFENFKFISYLF